jgi:hypothetical protein
MNRENRLVHTTRISILRVEGTVLVVTLHLSRTDGPLSLAEDPVALKGALARNDIESNHPRERKTKKWSSMTAQPTQPMRAREPIRSKPCIEMRKQIHPERIGR